MSWWDGKTWANPCLTRGSSFGQREGIHFLGRSSSRLCQLYILHLNGYPDNRIQQTNRPQNPQRNPQPDNTEWSYLKIPYISERLNHTIINIFRQENIPVHIAHKSHALKQALSYTSTERKCLNANAISLTRNYVYEEMPYTNSRATAAVNNTLVAPHASSMIAWENNQ